MLQKGHAPQSGISLLVTLAIVTIGLSLCAQAFSAGRMPIGGASTFSYDALGRPSSQRYIGHELPPLPKPVGTSQLTDPDLDLTGNAPLIDQKDPNGAPGSTTNRVVFSTTGVDEDQDGYIDPEYPDDPNFEANCNLWVMRSDGAEQVQLTDLPGDEVEPCYDPGARLVAFAYVDPTTGNSEIYTVEVRNPSIRSCLTDKQPGLKKRHPTWSPDGNTIAYQCDLTGNGDWAIYALPATGAGNQQQLTQPSAEIATDPAWVPTGNRLSPSGQAIAYTAVVGTTSVVRWIDARTGDGGDLTDGSGRDMQPAWSRDGAYLAFASDRLTEGDVTREFNIWRIATPTSSQGPPDPTLVSNWDAANTADDLNPTFSMPLDREPLRVYYESYRADTTSSARDIWVTRFSDTTNPVLKDLPGTYDAAGTARRVFGAGDDVIIRVPVYDADSGVGRVFAQIKDPDIKVYQVITYRSPANWDSGYEGDQYLEWDYQAIGQIELFDDGDTGNGDATANDGIFSGTYTIPSSLVSDMVIDIIARDNVGNEQNYDSIYGFTSETFSPAGNVLFVNDYCEGQHFIFESGYNNDFNSMWYTESWHTYNPSDSLQAGNEDYDTIRGYAASWDTDEPYKIWRVICRGPIPLSVYQYYLPTVEYQLDPTIAMNEPRDATPTVDQRVANRAIIWASPHTGNLWVADGSLIDAGTQADLGLFLDRGGRLMISGSDIGWALTLNGTTTNSFYNQYLRASFISHTIPGTVDWNPGYRVSGASRLQQNINYGVAGFMEIDGPGGDPVAYDPWVGQDSPLWHYGVTSAPDPEDMPTLLETPSQGDQNNDAHPFSYRPDAIQAIGGATVLYTYSDSTTAPSTAGVRYEDTNTTARCIYLAFGLESVHRQYHVSQGHCENKRSHLVHNALCWMRTGAFQGKVVAAEGGGPIHDEGDPLSNPIVLLWNGSHTPGDSADTPEYAVRCQDDGSYMISGVAPGFYSMEARRGPDYLTDHYDGWVTHGGWDPFVVDFALTKTRPGVIAGVVTSEATGAALALVNVRVYAVPEEPEEEEEEEEEAATEQTTTEEPDWDTLVQVGNAVTAVDGAYKVENLPVGDYYVLADGSPINYGNAWTRVSVTTGNTTTADFQLPAADGTLVAQVQTDAGAPVANALIEVVSNSVTVATGVTDADGEAEVGVQPGQYQVQAKAAGFSASSQQNVEIESSVRVDPPVLFTLEAEPGGSITGKIAGASSGSPVGGVIVHVLSNNVDIATPVTTTATLTDPGSGGATYNFIFPDVPTGSVTVRPEPIGFTATPTEQTVTVVSGKTTGNVNFVLTSLHTFPSGLQLVSTPYDYASTDPTAVLGIAAEDLLMATWQGSTQQYRQYPQAPADRFRLGTGYWLRLPATSDITLQGTSSVDPAAVSVQPGWNLLGDPFPATIDLFTTRVRDNSGNTMTMQQALAAGTVEGGMYAYALGGYQNTSVFLPWVGTWLKANKAFTLEISAAQGTLASLADAKPAVLTPKGGWLVNLQASASGLCDTACHFGMAPQATDGHDAGMDCAKPPVPDFAPYIYTSLGEGAAAGYAVDVRSSDDAVAQWPLQVKTNAVGADVSLRWPDLTAMPTDARPYLVDELTGKSIYMRTTGSYQFRAGVEPRQFTIVVRNGNAGALTVAGVAAQQAGGGKTQISYTLGTDAAVSVEIINIGGRSVRQLCSGAVQAQGVHSVSWDGRNAAGARVPAGRYIVRVTARADDGQQATGIAAIGLRR